MLCYGSFLVYVVVLVYVFCEFIRKEIREDDNVSCS